jgi:hypothetical protein
MAEASHVLGFGGAPRYIEPAPESEVLREGLEYLIFHQAERCPGCAECERFERVRRILLSRFRQARRLEDTER